MEIDLVLMWILIGIVIIKAFDTLILCLVPILIKGQSWSKEFDYYYQEFGGRRAVENHLPIVKRIQLVNRWIGQRSPRISNYFYRWFILVPIVSAIYAANLQEISAPSIEFVGVVIYFSIIIEILNEAVFRLLLGVSSNIQLSPFTDVSKLENQEIGWTTSDVLTRLVKSLIIRVTVLWCGFAVLYYALITLDPYAIKSAKSLLDCMYFSLVTLATTGFGDISPSSDCAKILVGTEIVLAWLLIVIGLFHCGASFTVDLTSENTMDKR